jgi:hypothetical protein
MEAELPARMLMQRGSEWRTEWWVGKERIAVTPWVDSPAQAIRDGLEADRSYRQVVAA